MRSRIFQNRSRAELRLIGGVIFAFGLSMAVIVSALTNESSLGAPSLWPWLLTGLQVLALWSAGERRWWGWLLGGSVQIPWIAYALVTNQIGFVPGCLVSATVQFCSFLRCSTRQSPKEALI